jgi:hypothetical protein
MNRVQLLEYTFSQAQIKQRSITSLFPTFNTRVEVVKGNGGARLSKTDKTTWVFKVTSGTEVGKSYEVKVEFVDVENKLKEIISKTKDIWTKENDWIDYRKLAEVFINKVDLRWQCSCPADLYYGGRFIRTKRDANLPPPENRRPKIKNPRELGVACKHLQVVFDVFPFYITTLAKWLKQYYSNVVVSEEEKFRKEREFFAKAGKELKRKVEEPVGYARGGKVVTKESINEKHQRTICYDLDGTLAEYNGWQGEEVIGEPIKNIVVDLKKEKENGSKIIIHTSRINLELHPDYTLEEQVELVKNWLNKNGIPYDEIWQGIGKPMADRYVDDHSVVVKDGKIMENKLDKLGICQDENLVEDIFGSVSEFARQVEEKGNEFIYGNISIKYNPKTDIHTFYKIMENKVVYMNEITRGFVQIHPDKIFLFGDNLEGKGMGGQAFAMRGEPNSIGIPTKKKPTYEWDAYMSDDEYEENIKNIDIAFAKIPKGKIIVIPKAGLGTGLAKLPEKAPRTFEYLKKKLADLLD